MAETQTDFHNLLFEVRDQVAHLTLNRPEAANAINIELARELEAAALFVTRTRRPRDLAEWRRTPVLREPSGDRPTRV